MSNPAPAPRRTVSTGFSRLAVATAVLTLVLIALGGAVRATESGLACPTWPGCFTAGDFVPGWQLNVWLEHTHRLIAGLVGLCIAALLVWTLACHRANRPVLWTTLTAAVAVNVQAALGALVVLHLLRAELVTAHLGMGMLVLACLIFLAVQSRAGARAGAHAGGPGGAPQPNDRRLARASLAVAGLAFVQILVGGHVTGIGAGLVYSSSPLLGIATFAPITSEVQAFNVAHRVLAVLLAIAVMALARYARAVAARGWLRRLPDVAVALVAVQIVIGVANVATDLSFLAVIPHLAVASWIWAVLVLQTVLAYRAAPADSASEPDEVTRARIEVPA